MNFIKNELTLNIDLLRNEYQLVHMEYVKIENSEGNIAIGLKPYAKLNDNTYELIKFDLQIFYDPNSVCVQFKNDPTVIYNHDSFDLFLDMEIENGTTKTLFTHINTNTKLFKKGDKGDVKCVLDPNSGKGGPGRVCKFIFT
ncbi:MAG: hypothetical protein IPN73_09140 [Saprospiraceae bacterium]|nr:hypothetical protein [Saprospiraceae bacterium]